MAPSYNQTGFRGYPPILIVSAVPFTIHFFVGSPSTPLSSLSCFFLLSTGVIFRVLDSEDQTPLRKSEAPDRAFLIPRWLGLHCPPPFVSFALGGSCRCESFIPANASFFFSGRAPICTELFMLILFPFFHPFNLSLLGFSF